MILDLLDGGATAEAARAAARVEPAASGTPSAKPPAAPAKAAAAPPATASAQSGAPAQSSGPDPLDAAVTRALKPTPLLPERARAQAQAAPSAPGPAPVPAAADGQFVSVDVVKGRDITELRFNWREDVTSALFRRRDQTWVLFDTPSRIELGALRIAAAPLVAGADQIPVVGGTAVRLAIDPSRHIRVRRERTIWVVDILSSAPAEGKGIDVVAEAGVAPAPGAAAQGGRVVLAVASAGKTLRLQDPDVGDRIDVVTVGGSGLGVTKLHRFVDFDLLESAQGIAVRPIADQLTVEALAKGVVISRPGGIRVSRDTDRARLNAAVPRADRLFDLTVWSKGPLDTFTTSEQELIRRAAAAEGADAKRKARLSLARFYLGNGFGPEALGVIHEIVRSDAGRDVDVAVRALRGAARVITGDYALASDDFRHPVLELNGQTAPWRGTIAAARGDWKSAAQQFRDLEAVIHDYPPWLAARFGLTAVEASLAVGDTGTAQARLEVLAKSELGPAGADMLAVLRGYYMKRTGDAAGAISLWRELARSPDRKAQARARYALANALLEAKDITMDEAVERLERLRYAWRGDVHEFDLLRRLSQLYAERGDNRRSLQTLKEAATYFRDIEGVQTIAQEMASTFNSLFADGTADSLQPVTALALFEEFRELTPPGEEGDAIVRKLAERLASVDLLDDAARLLEQQVKFRLSGVDRLRVATRAAELRVMDRKPEAALAILADGAAAVVPAALAQERILIQARAFAALGRPGDAIAAIDGAQSVAADRIRASIYWRAKDWRRAAEVFGLLIEQAPTSDGELAGLVLSRAVALALAGDEKGLAQLRAKHGDTMKASAFAKAFEAVAGDDVGATGDIRAAANIADRIATFQAVVSNPQPARAQPAGG